tara:strand:- start:771 stop:974 length:204 start_codon:yes stop_codon:yes gene_type:complete
MWPFTKKKEAEQIYYQVIERQKFKRIGIIKAKSWLEAEEKVRCSPGEILWQDEETELISCNLQVDIL